MDESKEQTKKYAKSKDLEWLKYYRAKIKKTAIRRRLINKEMQKDLNENL